MTCPHCNKMFFEYKPEEITARIQALTNLLSKVHGGRIKDQVEQVISDLLNHAKKRGV